MKPMLAQNWTGQLPYPLLVSAKLDGIRCLAHLIPDHEPKLWSRTEKPIVSMDHVVEALKDLQLSGEVILDGELYIHGKPFQELSGIIRKKSHTEPAKDVKYYIYDVAYSDTEVHLQPYHERLTWLQGLVPTNQSAILVHPSTRADNEDRLADVVAAHLQFGYEGSMVRPLGSTDLYQSESYGQPKRSKFLCKVKQFDDAEFEIIDVEEEVSIEGVPKGRTGKFVMREGDTGLIFRASGITDEMKQDSWLNRSKYIGRVATVKFFGRSLEGIPRHPNFVRFRDASDIS